jgi:hypothetical protein
MPYSVPYFLSWLKEIGVNATTTWIVANKGVFLVLIPIAGAYLAYRLGLKAYFKHKQKEYELVRSRYLENTLDLLSSGVESALSTFRNNWHYSLQILKQFRQLGYLAEGNDFEKRFVRTPSGEFQIVAAYRLGRLIGGDQEFWKMEQLLFAFVDEASDFFFNDFTTGLKQAIEGEVKRPKEEVADLYLERIQTYDKESHKYYHLLTELQTLSWFFEQEHLTFKAIKNFPKKKGVQDSISRLKRALQDILESEGNNTANNQIQSTGAMRGGSPACDL